MLGQAHPLKVETFLSQGARLLPQALPGGEQGRVKQAHGIDPIEARDERDREKKVAQAKKRTFNDCVTRFLAAKSVEWTNAKHRAQWRATLDTYASPHFGDLPVQAVDIDLVLAALTPIWITKTETASRVRGRIENVLDAAKVQGLRSGENPARWRGHLDHLGHGRDWHYQL